MCIVAIAWQLFDELPLVLLSNRDEFLERPTRELHQWSDQPIYAGRDNQSGGTWLGIHQEAHDGVYKSLNGQPEDSWFKTERLRGRLRQEVLPLIAENNSPEYWQQAAFDVLSDTVQAPKEHLPHTGVAVEIEHVLSSVYIKPVALGNGAKDVPTYGTRTQSIVTLTKNSETSTTVIAEITSRECAYAS